MLGIDNTLEKEGFSSLTKPELCGEIILAIVMIMVITIIMAFYGWIVVLLPFEGIGLIGKPISFFAGLILAFICYLIPSNYLQAALQVWKARNLGNPFLFWR